MEKKTIPLSVITDALEEAENGWIQYYNAATGEIRSVPDWNSAYEHLSDTEEDSEDYENSEEYFQLPSVREIDEYSIMSAFAEKKNSESLNRALAGRHPFRRFKDQLYEQNLEDEYHAFRFRSLEKLARQWCLENDIPVAGVPH